MTTGRLFILLVTLSSAAYAEDRFCENGQFTIDARFDAGAFAECNFRQDDFVELTIRPEDDCRSLAPPKARR